MKPDHHYSELFHVFTQLENQTETEAFLRDILTPQELEAVAERWQIAQQLLQGKPQREIAQNLDIAIATISRGSRMVKYGTGGFKAQWKKQQS